MFTLGESKNGDRQDTETIVIEDTKTRPNKATSQKTTEPPTLTIDWELYGQHLEDSDMSDAEKRKFIEALWSIVVSFVDLGFGVHPAQLVTGNCCEQDQRNGVLVTQKSGPMVNCLRTTKADFKASAHRCPGPARTRSPK